MRTRRTKERLGRAFLTRAKFYRVEILGALKIVLWRNEKNIDWSSFGGVWIFVHICRKSTVLKTVIRYIEIDKCWQLMTTDEKTWDGKGWNITNRTSKRHERFVIRSMDVFDSLLRILLLKSIICFGESAPTSTVSIFRLQSVKAYVYGWRFEIDFARFRNSLPRTEYRQVDGRYCDWDDATSNKKRQCSASLPDEVFVRRGPARAISRLCIVVGVILWHLQLCIWMRSAQELKGLHIRSEYRPWTWRSLIHHDWHKPELLI